MKKLYLLSLGLAFASFSCQPPGSDQSMSGESASFSDAMESLSTELPEGEENGHVGSGEEGSHGGKHNAANDLMDQQAFQDLVDFFESPDRAAWQKPDEVIAMLGDLEGKKVMDLGAGTGYFAFRMQQAGASVVAAEVDDRFIYYLEDQRDSLGLPEADFEVRKVFYDDPLTSDQEFDIFFTVDTYHHIEQRPKYLRKVLQGIQPGGTFVVVDFKRRETPHGPPVGIRIQAERIQRELLDAGFVDVTIDSELLPEQNIIKGYRPR